MTQKAGGGRRFRVGLLDDHELILDGMADWITRHETRLELTVAETTWVGLVRSSGFPADLIIMDLNLSEEVSIEARLRTCRAAGAKVIVVTALDTEEGRRRALAAGASAYLIKAQPMRELMAVVHEVMGIEEDSAHQVTRPAGSAGNPSTPRLSDGERMALLLYIAGNTTVEVADEMHVQYETAKTYLRRVREKYTKAGRPTSTRSDLIRRAAEDELLT